MVGVPRPGAARDKNQKNEKIACDLRSQANKPENQGILGVFACGLRLRSQAKNLGNLAFLDTFASDLLRSHTKTLMKPDVS